MESRSAATGLYTNLFDGGRYSGAATPTLSVFNIVTNDSWNWSWP